MSDPALHIKDAYYFDVPKFLWRPERTSRDEFPQWWVRLDDDYQKWEAAKQYDALVAIAEPKTEKPLAPIPPKQEAISQYEHWKHADHSRVGIPFERYLKLDKSLTWYQQRAAEPAWSASWSKAQSEAAPFHEYTGKWSDAKLKLYNQQLRGKVLIPQPFGGRPKNLYEPAEGFVVSKFMIIELVVAVLLVAVFAWVASRIRSGDRPRGRLANLVEAFLVFLRDQVARPAIGKHDADRFLPLLWTIFFFVLGCNLFGMLPWAGAPTASFGVTLALALITLLTVIICGSRKFGVIGFWKNQVPHMDLPWYMAILIIPPLFLIEVGGLLIKHAVLAVRLLANMVAGHLVLLGIMGLALVAAKLSFGSWAGVAAISVVAAAAFSVLELFVAFLQAFVFTMLSALFIGAAIHHH